MSFGSSHPHNCPFPSHSFLCVAEDVILQLLPCLPHSYGHDPSGTINKNRLFPPRVASGHCVSSQQLKSTDTISMLVSQLVCSLCSYGTVELHLEPHRSPLSHLPGNKVAGCLCSHGRCPFLAITQNSPLFCVYPHSPSLKMYLPTHQDSL